MGVLGWIGGKAKRQAAIEAVQTFFEVSREHGAFPAGDARTAAQQAVDLAIARAPDMLDRRWSKYVLASMCMAVVVLEEDEPIAIRDIHAMALYGMLQAAQLERHRLSYEELSALDTAHRTYLLFRSSVPSPVVSPRRLSPGPMTDAPPAGSEIDVIDSARGREAARAELVRRMRELDGKS